MVLFVFYNANFAKQIRKCYSGTKIYTEEGMPFQFQLLNLKSPTFETYNGKYQVLINFFLNYNLI